MARMGRAASAVLSSTIGLCLPALASASGQIQIFPTTQTFRSHQACRDALEAAYAEDRKQIAPLTIDAQGRRQQVELFTKGVEKIGQRRARYDATLWFHSGWRRTDLPATPIEASHSYAHRIRECVSRVMKTSGEDGYTLSTFDPV